MKLRKSQVTFKLYFWSKKNPLDKNNTVKMKKKKRATYESMFEVAIEQPYELHMFLNFF